MKTSRRQCLAGILSLPIAMHVSARMGRGGVAVSSGPAPVLLYTDIVAGSATNGEGGAGAYLTLYGLNFGTDLTKIVVTIGGQQVANLRYSQLSKINSSIRSGMPDIYALGCQIGSAGVQALTAGSTYAIGLTVNGIAANTVDVMGNPFNFTIQPGHFYFVDTVNGNDSTGVVDDITHPFRYNQNYVGTGTNGYGTVGVFVNLKAGDTVVNRTSAVGGCQDQNGYDTRWVRFKNDVAGSAPNGTIGNGYIHFTAYPGPINGNAPEDFYMFTPGTATKGGGLQGVQSSWARPNVPTYGQYVSISNMRFSCAAVNLPVSDCAPVYLQNSSDFWRVVNLDISWPATNTGTPHVMAGAVTGNGFNVKVFGIYAHDIAGGGTALENHGYYWDGSNTTMQNFEQGYCTAINCTTGQNLQFHNSGTAGQFSNCYVHDMWCENAAKYGLKQDSLGTVIRFWNIVVNHTAREGFQIDSTGSGATVDLRGENITYYDCQVSPGAYTGVFDNEGGTMSGTCSMTNCIMAYPPTRSSTSGTFNPGTSLTQNGCVYKDFSGHITTKPASDTNGIYADPGFTSNAIAPNSDFRLVGTSAALNRAVAATINPTRDLSGNPQPRAGKALASCGAFA